MIGAIGLILTAILNPEGIALANAEIGKKLWQRIRRPAPAPSPEPASSSDSAAAGGR